MRKSLFNIYVLATLLVAGAVVTACGSDEEDTTARTSGGGAGTYTPVVNVDINATNFPDANFRKWVLAQEYGEDGMLTVQENMSVTTIDVSDKGIRSLKGIEYFAALKSLLCSNNKLTELSLSRNTKLTLLECHQNQIKAEAMQALVESLPTVSNGKMNVTYFEYEGNEFLYRHINAAKAKGWTPMFLDKNWNWTAYSTDNLILINETNFPDANFRNYLQRYYGKDGELTKDEIANVTEIDVREQEIRSLKGIEFFTALTYLNCDNNQLTTIDVSKNTALTYLGCDGNQLTTIDVSKNTALTGLECSSNKLTTLNVKGCMMLKYLRCQYNQLTTLNVKGCLSLEKLWCYQNQIKGAAMDALIESMPNKSDRDGELRVIDSTETQDGNVMTTTQVEAAKAKHWMPYYHNRRWSHGELPRLIDTWSQYTGSNEGTGTLLPSVEV